MSSVKSLVADCLGDKPGAAFATIERNRLWEQITEYALANRLAGILLHEMERRGIAATRSAARQLNAYADHLRAAHQYRLRCITPILRALNDRNVPFLLLKGAALSAVLYHDAGLRPMVDVDILIRPTDAAEAENVLHDRGCQAGPDLVRRDFFPRFHYEREYHTPDSPSVKIDLHVRPFRPLRYSRTIPDEALWRDPRPVNFGGVRSFIPGPNEMLIHLAVHAACHGAGELRWLYDIRRCIEAFGHELDWGFINERCKKWKLTLPFWRAIRAVEATLGPAMEARNPSQHRAGPLDYLALWQAPHGGDRPATDVAVNFITTPGIGFRMTYLAAVLLPGDSHLRQAYPYECFGWRLRAHGRRLVRIIGRTLSRKPGAA